MRTIIEIGAHTGTETFKFLDDSDAVVFAFEPQQQHFTQLFLRSQHYPRLTVLPFAVDLGDNQEPLFHLDNGQDSLQPPNMIFGQYKFTMTWTIRLGTFLELYGIQRVDYLRIDAPWNEGNCLESIDPFADRLQTGRIKCYRDDNAELITWLYDHGFSTQIDNTSDDVTRPNIRFWRN
jgi:hypothetical protein